MIYEHKSRLERAIQDEKDNHHKTKEAKQDLEMKYSREKQEHLNRIQLLSQKHRLLQTQFEDLQKEMSKSEADYQILKSDYQKEAEEYKEKIVFQSQQCHKDKKYLTEEIADLKKSQREFSEGLTQCQVALKSLQLQIVDQKDRPVIHERADNVNKPLYQDSVMHIKRISNTSAQVAGAANVRSKREPPVEFDKNEKPLLAFRPDNIVKNLEPARGNRAVRQLEKDQHHRPQVSLPPPSIAQQPPIRKVEAMKGDMGRVPLNRGPIHPLGVNGANAAVIEAPKEPENKLLLNKDQNEHEDEEEVEEKNEENNGNQKDDDDYQYEKNGGGDGSKREKVNDFPGAIPENRNLNKIQNPAYPDDVEVFNH